MAISAVKIEERLRAAFPDAQIRISDLAGDGDHYALRIVSRRFRGKTRVEQHRLVHDALKQELGEALHALALQTAPDKDEPDSATETDGPVTKEPHDHAKH